MRNILEASKEELVAELWATDPEVEKILGESEDIRDARERLFEYLNSLERHYFDVYSDRHFKDVHVVEKNNAKECIRVLKNVIRTENERMTGFSALRLLLRLPKNKGENLDEVGEGFFCEFISLLRGAQGRSMVEAVTFEHLPLVECREVAISRSRILDSYSQKMTEYMRK